MDFANAIFNGNDIWYLILAIVFGPCVNAYVSIDVIFLDELHDLHDVIKFDVALIEPNDCCASMDHCLYCHFVMM